MKRSMETRYLEGILTYIRDNTAGMDTELDGLTARVRSGDFRWIGRPLRQHNGRKRHVRVVTRT